MKENAVTIGESLRFGNVNRDSAVDNRVFLWRDGYLVPDTLELCDAGSLAVTEPLKAKPAMFAAEDLCVDQHFCNSSDGTKIPYFVMRKKDIVLDGTNPTLLDAYVGFEISMLPGYAAGVGAAWLEQGGVKVIANIRGGGEYGPAWHQAGLIIFYCQYHFVILSRFKSDRAWQDDCVEKKNILIYQRFNYLTFFSCPLRMFICYYVRPPLIIHELILKDIYTTVKIMNCYFKKTLWQI